MSGPGPERPGNNERLGRRGNFIARSAGRCVCDEAERQTRSKRGEPGGELGDSGARFIEFSKYPCTRRCRTRRLHFSTASIYLALPFSFFSPPPFSSSSLAPYFPLRRKPPAPLPLPPFRFDPTPFLAPSRSAPSPSPVRWRPMIPDFSISPSTCKRGCFSGVSESESCRGTEIGNCHSKRQTLSRRDDFGFF